MCDCMNKLENKWKKVHPDLLSVNGQYEYLSGRAFMNVTINLPKKKPIINHVLYEFCPHCRRKISRIKGELK